MPVILLFKNFYFGLFDLLKIFETFGKITGNRVFSGKYIVLLTQENYLYTKYVEVC